MHRHGSFFLYPEIQIATEVLPTPSILFAVKEVRADTGVSDWEASV
ncbi:MAG TPA: hypothetical protein VN045_12255 [Microbacteriaceae bacterium]|nr:hypothetical protein [Microbacteriaceae bacterium]